MAPEYSDEVCSGSGNPYRSVLPPVANHYAIDVEDFNFRLSRLSPEDLLYLVNKVLSGEESLHCLPLDYYAKFEERVISALGLDISRKVLAMYTLVCE